MNNSILFSIDNSSLELHSLNRTPVSLYITFRFPVYLNDNICFPNRSFLFKYFFIQTRDLFTMRFRRTTRWSRYCVTHEDRNWNLFSGVFDQFRREIYKGSKKNSDGCCWGELADETVNHRWENHAHFQQWVLERCEICSSVDLRKWN